MLRRRLVLLFIYMLLLPLRIGASNDSKSSHSQYYCLKAMQENRAANYMKPNHAVKERPARPTGRPVYRAHQVGLEYYEAIRELTFNGALTAENIALIKRRLTQYQIDLYHMYPGHWSLFITLSMADPTGELTDFLLGLGFNPLYRNSDDRSDLIKLLELDPVVSQKVWDKIFTRIEVRADDLNYEVYNKSKIRSALRHSPNRTINRFLSSAFKTGQHSIVEHAITELGIVGYLNKDQTEFNPFLPATVLPTQLERMYSQYGLNEFFEEVLNTSNPSLIRSALAHGLSVGTEVFAQEDRTISLVHPMKYVILKRLPLYVLEILYDAQSPEQKKISPPEDVLKIAEEMKAKYGDDRYLIFLRAKWDFAKSQREI